MTHHPVLRATTDEWLVAAGFTRSTQLDGWWHRGRVAVDASYLASPVADVSARCRDATVRLGRVPLGRLEAAVARVEAALAALAPPPPPEPEPPF